jgi:hypothetical protein
MAFAISAKGYGDSIKWVPSNMKPIARLAIQRLKNLSHMARAIASYPRKW